MSNRTQKNTKAKDFSQTTSKLKLATFQLKMN
jgi:hypothetical protein